ncbi:putative MFS-type transporter YwoD [Sporolactobacillus inulinus]|nr:MFS transporter [Sporolactobacillus inulinus]GEB77940.1 putative MFS-type transporter YwoD [Sporolactobacillus inulinus]
MTRNKKKATVFMTAIATGTLLNPLNSSMIALALHSIQDDYQLSFAMVSWLISGFYLVSAVGQPVAGKMGDLIGRKKLFLTGLVIAACASLAAPIAPAFAFLLIFRLLQAAGSSAVYPSGVSLVHDYIAHEKQGTALAVLAISASVMTAFGPTVGGFLIVWGGWPSIFYVNLPFICVSFILGCLVIPKDVKEEKLRIRTLLARLDLIGMALFSFGIVSLLWFLLELEHAPQFFALIVSVICFTALACFEWHCKRPFIDVRLLKENHRLTEVYLLFILMNLVNYCLFYGMPNYFQSGLKLSVRTSGAMMLFMSAASVAVSLLCGRWIERKGTEIPIKVSAALTAAGAVFLLFAVGSGLGFIGTVLILFGIGYGICNVALQAAMLDAVQAEAVGVSSGLFQTCRFIGSIGSTAILGLIFGSSVTQAHLSELAWFLIAISVLALLISFCFFRGNRPPDFD